MFTVSGIFGGVATQKTERYRKFQIWDWFFSVFFRFFFGFSILANFDWFKGFFLVILAFIRHLLGFIGIKYVIRQFLASQDLIVDMILE